MMACPDPETLAEAAPLELVAVCSELGATIVMLFFNRPLTQAQIITIRTLIDQHIRILDGEQIGRVQ